MSICSLRCSWRRVLNHAAAGLQAQLRNAPFTQPAALPSLQACLLPVASCNSALVPPASAAWRSFSSPAVSPFVQAATRPAEQLAASGSVEPRPGYGLCIDRSVPLINWTGESVGTVTLPGAAFDVDVRVDILHRVVRWQRAKKQQGTHKAKTRSEVRGGGRKVRKQKGTGRARAGTIRAPQWRGGGKAHGPVVRSHEHKLQRKVRQMGLRCALSAKAREGRLLVMDSLAVAEPKTKLLDTALDAVLADAPRRSLLMIDTSKEGPDGGADLRKAAANLPWVDVLPVVGANVYSILQRDYLVLSREALTGLVDRATRRIGNKRFIEGDAPQQNVTAAMAELGVPTSPIMQ